MTYSIKHNEKLSDSPCTPLMIEGWNELIKINYVDPLVVLDENVIGDHQVIWGEFKKKPVALITFTHHPDDHYTWIRMAYVNKDHRQHKLYQKMYALLRTLAIKEGMPKISGGIYHINEPMQKAAMKVGRVIEYSVWTEFLDE